MEDRQRPKGFGGHRPLVGEDRQLAPFRSDDPTGNGNEVTQVDIIFPSLELIGADFGQGQHDLEPLAIRLWREAPLQGGEAEFAGVADENHAAGYRNHSVGFLAGGQMTPTGPNRSQGMSPRHRDRIRRPARRQQPLPFILPNAHLFGQVGRRQVEFGRIGRTG
jgi:hypothetical protein